MGFFSLPALRYLPFQKADNEGRSTDGEQYEMDNSKHRDQFFVPDLCNARAAFILVLVAELFVLIQVLAFPGAGHFDWERLATTSMFVQWIALSGAFVLCQLRSVLRDQPLPVVVLSCLVTIVIITVLFSLLAQWGIGDKTAFPDWQQLFQNSLVALIITAMLLRHFYIQHAVTRQQAAHADARFQALQARIRPHFLFNSMNIIASLIHIDQDKAEQAIEDLSDLFRSSLQGTGQRISLNREIDLCQRYLRIEQHRLGERLNSTWHLEGLPEYLTIPPLTLQPVIENAVYHGIQPRAEGGTVSIDISLENDNVVIRVTNPVPDSSGESSKEGNRVALDNIRSRLHLLFGHRGSINTRLTLNQGAEIYETIIMYPA